MRPGPGLARLGRELLTGAHDPLVAVEADLLDDPRLRVGVHRLEVAGVVAVLGHLLQAGGHLEGVGRVQGVGGVLGLLHLVDLIERGLAGVGVVPGVDEAVGLGDREGPQPGLGVGAVGVGDGDVGAVAVPGPAVEGAAQAAVVEDAVAEVGAEVRAVGLVAVQRAVAVPPEDQLGAEVAPGDDLARRDLVGLGDLEPAERQGEREAVAHDVQSTESQFSALTGVRTQAARWADSTSRIEITPSECSPSETRR